MTPTLLTPPEPPRFAPIPEPALPERIPLGRPRAARTPLVSHRAVVGSLVVHALLAVAVWLVPVSLPGGGERVDRGAREPVSYLDLGDFPGAEDGAAGAPAAGETGLSGFPVPDSVSAILPRAQTPATPATAPGATRPAAAGMRFPTRAPTGLPGAPAASDAGAARAGAAGPGAGTASGTGGAGGSLGQGMGGGRMQPGYRDPRLYTPRELPPETPPTDIQRYRERLQAKLDVYNDSVAEAGERERRLRNWTFKGKDGKEWGIAEGGIPVVAGRRIPLPVGVGVPIPRSQDRDDESRERASELRQIDRQAQDQDRDRYVRERNRAMRERQDSIRRARKP